MMPIAEALRALVVHAESNLELDDYGREAVNETRSFLAVLEAVNSQKVKASVLEALRAAKPLIGHPQPLAKEREVNELIDKAIETLTELK